MDPEALLNLLAEQHWIENEDAERLLHEYETQSVELFDFLEASGVGSKIEILQVAAEARGTEFVGLDKVEFPPKLFDSVPLDVVRIYRCVPIHDSKEQLKLCLADPLDDLAAEELATILGRPIKVVVADPLLVEDLVERRVRGTLSFAPSVEVIKTAPVAASMGAVELLQEDSRTVGAPSNTWLYAWALLAFAAAATSAVYLHQRGTLTAANKLITEFDMLQEQRDLANLALDRRAYDLEQMLEKFDTELDRASADTVRIAQLDAELRRLEGRLQTLAEILPEDANSRNPASFPQPPAD
jgi:hypothetical protein